MATSRRRFLQHAAAFSGGFAGLRSAIGAIPAGAALQEHSGAGYGPVAATPEGILALPDGFHATVFSKIGEPMNDGLLVPGKHDGMGAFEGPDGLTILIRNHEISPGHNTVGPFDALDDDQRASFDARKVYDIGTLTGPYSGPSRGGCTALLYDTKGGNLIHHALVLAGCEHNCAGGVTPHGTWISCEESVVGPADALSRAQVHGWCFEVPATANPKLIVPQPIKPMGRFNHEAVAVDPATGIVYMTEDRQDGVLWRYLPKDPHRLLEGGQLQALSIMDQPQRDMRNWEGTPNIARGKRHATRWITMDDVESADDSLRYRAFERGAARFARGEGMYHGDGCIHFACTTGGATQHGQLWKYVPASPELEGGGGNNEHGGHLELFIEPNDATVLEHADNITVAPWGDLIVCEDGLEDQFLLGVTPEGEVYTLAHNLMNHSEFAGATFSPDGTTLFVNIQNPGLTLAITGPWAQHRA
jgi:secreted PhoX family phosphatase